MASIVDSDTPSRQTTPEWYEYRTKKEHLEIGRLVKPVQDEKDIAKASRVEKGKEKVAEWVEDVDEESENKDAVSELPKKAEVSITEKGKEKAIEWVEDVDEEGENKDAVSALPKHTKEQKWPVRTSSKEHFGHLMDFTSLSDNELASLKLPATPDQMGDDDGSQPIQNIPQTPPHAVTHNMPQQPWSPISTPQGVTPRNLAAPNFHVPFGQHPAAWSSTSSFAPSITRTPESAFRPDLIATHGTAVQNLRALLNSSRGVPIQENNATLFNYLKNYNFDIEAAAVGYDTRMEAIARTRARLEDNMDFVRRFNRRG